MNGMRFHLKNWSIGRKIIFLGFTTTLVSTGAILIALGVVLRQYVSVNDQLKIDYERRVNKAISLSSDSIKLFAEDYAGWDEMYKAVDSGDTEWFIRSTTGSLTTFQADSYWIYRNDGKVLYQEKNPDLHHNIPLPDSSVSAFSTSNTNDFFAFHNDALIHYAAAPITDPTRPELRSNGFMIVAKVWEQPTLDHIGDIMGASVRLVPTDTDDDAGDGQIHVIEPLKDVQGNSVIAIENVFEDRSLELVRNSLIAMLVITTILGGSLIIFSYRLQYHWFVDPISKLIRELRAEIGSEQSEQAMLSSKDELEVLKLVVADHIEKLHLNERLSLTVEASTNGIAITDLKGNINYVNEAWKKLNGYTLEEAKGSNPRLLHSGKTPPETYTKMWAALTAGKSFTTETIVNRRKDGSEYDCRLSVYPIKESGETVGYVGIQQDISHRKEVDRMKTEFISMASHQLRTPLSAMRWFGELLLQKKAGELTAKQQELVQNFYDSTLRMIALVNSLLNISRIESGRMIVEPVPTRLPDLLNSIIVELSARIEAKKLTLTQHIDPTLPEISVDPQLVHEVYSNLLTNAVKYTPEGGKIAITIEQSGANIKSSITDTGVGIPVLEQPQVFNKFFRAKNVSSLETDGTGLGLYLVKLIVNSSDGEVGFESTEGKGTTFWFTLPKVGMEKKSGSVHIT